MEAVNRKAQGQLKEHISEGGKTTCTIVLWGFLAAICLLAFTFVFYTTPHGLNVARFEQWKIMNPNDKLTNYGYPHDFYGYTAFRDGGVQNTTEGILWTYVIVDILASLTSFSPLICVLGFLPVWQEKRTLKAGMAVFGAMISLTGFVVFSKAPFKGQGWANPAMLLRTATNAVFGVVLVTFVSYSTRNPGAKCGEKCSYFKNVALSNTLATLVGGVVFPRSVFPMYTSPSASGFFRSIIAMFGSNGVFFLVYAFGRVWGYSVDRMALHRGWGVVYFVLIVSALYGRLLLAGISGSTMDAGDSISKRLGMFGMVWAVEMLRFVTRLFTKDQDRVFGKAFKIDISYDANKVVPEDIKYKPEEAAAGAMTPISDAPNVPAAAAAKEGSSEPATKAGSLFARNPSVQGKRAARKPSTGVRTDRSDFLAETWLLVAVSEVVAVVYCTCNMMLIEIMVAEIPVADAIYSFIINYLMQALPQMIFIWAYCCVSSVRTNFGWHATVDGEIKNMFLVTVWIVFTLGPWLASTTNVVVVNNMYRNFDYVNDTFVRKLGA